MGNHDLTWPALTLLIGAVAWVIGTGLRRGSLLSPYSLILLILLSIFGVRPLLMPGALEHFDFYGHNIASGYRQASIIGFVGTACFIVGYVARQLLARRNPRQVQEEKRPLLPGINPGRAHTVAWALIGAWFVAMIALGGGTQFLAVLFAGRSEEANNPMAGVPAIVPALPVVACLMAATIRFKWERLRRYTRGQNLAYWLVAVMAVIPPSASGSRRFLIPSVVVMVVGALGTSWARKVRPVSLVAGFAGFLILAVIPFVRSAGSRTGRTDLVGAIGDYFETEGVRGVLNNFFLSYDTEMFNWVAYFAPRMGDTIPYGWGRGTIGEALTMPLPAALSPFERWADVLLTYAFGGGCASGVPCPVPSIIGVLYTDLAWVGLAFGMAGLGALCAGFEPALLRSSGSATAALLLCAGFAVLFARGSSLAQVWIAVQVFIAWWAVYQATSTLSGPPRISLRTGRQRVNPALPHDKVTL